MKKNTLFKIIAIVILVYSILTWILGASYYSGGLQDYGMYEIGLFELLNIPVQSLGYFSYMFLFILAIGAFYAVLEATGLYRKALDLIVKKAKKHKLVWLISITVLISIISSVAGLGLGLVFIFPFIISLLILLEYDKFTALLATLGATIVGMIGSTYSYTAYGISNGILGLKYTDGMLIKVILFVLSLGLLITYMLLHLKKLKKKDNSDLDIIIPEKKEASKKACKKVWPIFVAIAFVLVILILGTINWSGAFEISWFDKALTSINAVKIGDYAIFDKLLGGLTALGTWNGPTQYIYYTVLLLIVSVIMALVYRVNFDEYFKSLFDGAKEYFGAALLSIFACCVLVIVSSFPIFLTIVKAFTQENFNIATMGLSNIFGSLLYVDIYYYPQYVLEYFSTFKSVDATILNVLFVSIYGLVMLVAPTSIVLLTTLTTTKTKYMDWLKFIWKLALSLLVVIFVVLAIAFVI